MSTLSSTAKQLKLACIAPIAPCCRHPSAFCVLFSMWSCRLPLFFCQPPSNVQLMFSVSFSFTTPPSLSLSSTPSLTSNYPVYVKGKTFPSSWPVQLTSASCRGLCLNVLSCLSPRSTLPVLPVLKYKSSCLTTHKHGGLRTNC